MLQIILFVFTVLQGIAAAVYIAKEYSHWRSTRTAGEVKPFVIHRPLLLLPLILGAFITAAFGFWLVFRKPVTQPAVTTSAVSAPIKSLAAQETGKPNHDPADPPAPIVRRRPTSNPARAKRPSKLDAPALVPPMAAKTTPSLTPFERSKETDSPKAREEVKAEINRLAAIDASAHPTASLQERVSFVNQELKSEGYPYHVLIYDKAATPNASASETASAEPCVGGSTIIENATATAPPGFPAHTTGILIKGRNPCLTIKNPVAIGLTVGIEVDSTSATSDPKP